MKLLGHYHDDGESPSLASRMQRGVACPVLRALGGDVSQQCGNAPSFDPISTCSIICGIVEATRRSPRPALTAFAAIAKRMELTLNRDKTRVTRLSDGFDFIGFQFVKRKSPSSGKNTIYIFPAKSAQQKIRNRLKYLTSRRAPISPKQFVAMVNPIVTGWVNYFRHTNASQAFRGLQRFVNIRFRRYLTQRSKGRGFGWRRFPNSKL